MVNSRSILSAILAAATAACDAPTGESVASAAPAPAAEAAPAGNCAPLETRPPNAPDQRPAFAGQTRACAAPSNVAFDVTVLAKGLEHPWAVEPLAGGGLLDVALGPGFAADRTIYWSYSQPRPGGNATSVARGVLSADRQRVEQAATATNNPCTTGTR